MKSVLAGGSCTAAILAFGISAYAQTTGQPAGQSSSQPTAQAQSGQSSDEQMTITGCVQSETDYRRAKSAGQGGVAGTGIGAGNEFVLINASKSSAGSSSSATGSTASGTATSTGATGSATGTSAPGTAPGMPSTSGSITGTTGTSGAMAQNAFELTGPGEGQLQQYVGKRVEVIGRLKSGRAQHSGTSSSTGTQSGTTGTQGTTTGTQSGTSTTGATRSASDPMGQDLNLPEFEVVSVREASGSCPSTPDRR